jgi:hypothetical protein
VRIFARREKQKAGTQIRECGSSTDRPVRARGSKDRQVSQALINVAGLPQWIRRRADAGFSDLGVTQPDAVDAINQLAALGVVLGNTVTTDYPPGNVLRWQMALFLTRSLQAGGVTPE